MEENKEIMENEELETAEILAEEILNKDSYQARPKWQIVAAWIGIAIVAVGFVLYCWHIATAGGM